MKIMIRLCCAFLVTVLSLNANETKDDTQMTKTNRVIIETNKGNIEVQLFPEIAPKACENFVELSKTGYYNGIAFHRVIKSFMIQGGDPTGNGSGGKSIWGMPFEDEFDSSKTFSKPYLLAMANAGPSTNGSQFFITTMPTEWLNGKHTIFGEVVDGKAVVDAIEKTPVDGRDRPIEAQIITGVTIVKD